MNGRLLPRLLRSVCLSDLPSVYLVRTTMAPVRLRHPGGVSTIDVDFDGNLTVQDFQQKIYTASQILPSLQDCRCSLFGKGSGIHDIRVQ